MLFHLYKLLRCIYPVVTHLGYHTGLNVTAAMLLVRGPAQVLGSELSSSLDAAISGIAGMGHILLGISVVLLLLGIRRAVSAAQS